MMLRHMIFVMSESLYNTKPQTCSQNVEIRQKGERKSSHIQVYLSCIQHKKLDPCRFVANSF